MNRIRHSNLPEAVTEGLTTGSDTGRSARDAWISGKAHAEQIPEARALLKELEHASGCSPIRPRLERLAQATRAWLGGKATLSILRRTQVAMPTAGGEESCAWQPVLGPGEDDRSRHAAISRWLNEETNSPFLAETAWRLAWCAIQHEFWLPAQAMVREVRCHQYYHELLRQLDSAATTRGNLEREAPGIYHVFRPSVSYPGHYVVGLFAIARLPDPPRRGPAFATPNAGPLPTVLRSAELLRFAESDSQGSGWLVQSPQVEEVFLGYLVKKSRQFLVHAFNSITRSFQFTVIGDFLLSDPAAADAAIPRRDAARIEMMSGIAVGLVGQVGFYSVPTVLLRIANLAQVASDSELVGRLRACKGYDATGVLPGSEIPPFVLKQFDIIGRQVILRE